ncbi:MAG: hypothetical protein R3E01_34695 [Pirellulaceae bacterium]|nr:hypothetical protein [Planctomycetales bacterium]
MALYGRKVIQLSVDTELGADQTALAEYQRRRELLHGIRAIVSRHQLPVTWGMGGPDASSLQEMTGGISQLDEIALQADSAWCGAHAKRSLFLHELTSRLDSAADAGETITTLLLGNNGIPDCWDVMVRRGIRAIGVIGSSHPTFRNGGEKPQQVRFGLWRFPTHLVLPYRQVARFRWTSPRPCRTLIKLANEQSRLVRIAIRISDMVGMPGSERGLDRMLEHVAVARDQAGFTVETLSDSTQRAMTENIGRPSRSLLKEAA